MPTFTGSAPLATSTDKAMIEVTRFTVENDGEHRFQWVTETASEVTFFATRLVIGGATGASGNPKTGVQIDYTADLVEGQVVVFEYMSYSSTPRTISSTWTITAPVPLPANAHKQADIEAVYFGSQKARAFYKGSTLVWEAAYDFGFARAETGPYRVMFLGSSTTQGYQISDNEGYVNNMMGAFLTAKPMVDSTLQDKATSGTRTAPTAKGFHFLNAGLGGTTSANYYGSARSTLVNGFKPHLVLHMIGSNDYQQQMPIATYKNNLTAVVGDINTKVGGAANVTHVLIQSYRREDRADTGITWAQYGVAQKEVADLYENAVYIDTMPDFTAMGWNSSNLMADNIHTTVEGYQTLARFVAQRMRLDDREGQTIWALDAGDFTTATGTPASNFPATADSMQQKNVSSSGAARPLFRNLAAGKWFDFDGTDDYMDIVGGFTGAHGMPITVYIVVESMGGTAGSADQPVFSRSVSADNGWWWVWRQKSGNTIKAALNSAFGNALGMGTFGSTSRGIVAVTMFSNSRGRMYINSRISMAVNADTIDTTLGPWMKSLRLGANSGLGNFSPMKVREIRFEHGGWNESTVKSRMSALATKHGIALP